MQQKDRRIYKLESLLQAQRDALDWKDQEIERLKARVQLLERELKKGRRLLHTR